jgi:hypothetical protein
MKTRKLLGIPISKLKKMKCYLTYEGADELYACSDGLKLWKRKKWGKLEAAEVFSNFVDFCPYCFTMNRADNINSAYCTRNRHFIGYGSLTCEVACTCNHYVHQYRKLGHCSDPDTQKLCEDNEEAYQLAILLLRAVIAHERAKHKK